MNDEFFRKPNGKIALCDKCKKPIKKKEGVYPLLRKGDLFLCSSCEYTL